MRPVKLLLALACCMPALPAATSQAVETRKVQSVTIEQMLATPGTFQSITVRFPAIWIGVSNVYDSQRSHFHPQRYVNFAVWDERASLWDPAARAKPLVSLYMSKDQPGADRPSLLKRYQMVEIEARIVAIIDGVPWFDVQAIRPLEKQGAFTDSAIAQLERAIAFTREDARDLAEEHFAAALTADLPASARISVGEMRARSLIDAGRWDEAAAVLRAIIPAAEADARIPGGTKAGLHAALARCLSESAGTDVAKHTEAVSEAQLAVAIDPTLSEAYAVLGVSLAGLGRFDEARLQCDRAVRMRPDDAAVRLALGRILDQQGRHDEAIDALKRAIDLTPKDARVHRAIAAAYLNRGRTGDVSDLPIAYKECDITLRLQAQDAEAHWLAGQVIEVAMGRSTELPLPSGKAVPTREQAKERYQAALTVDANHAAAKASLQALLDAEAAEKAAAAAKAQAEADAKAEAEAKAKAEADAKLKAEADAKAEAEAKAKAEADAKLKAEADAKTEAEAKARAEAEAKAESEAKAKAEAAAKAAAEAAAPASTPAP